MSSFLNDFIAYNSLLSFFSQSITFPKAPFPNILINVKSSMETSLLALGSFLKIVSVFPLVSYKADFTSSTAISRVYFGKGLLRLFFISYEVVVNGTRSISSIKWNFSFLKLCLIYISQMVSKSNDNLY